VNAALSFGPRTVPGAGFATTQVKTLSGEAPDVPEEPAAPDVPLEPDVPEDPEDPELTEVVLNAPVALAVTNLTPSPDRAESVAFPA
jgi:hypothetical protein